MSVINMMLGTGTKSLIVDEPRFLGKLTLDIDANSKLVHIIDRESFKLVLNTSRIGVNDFLLPVEYATTRKMVATMINHETYASITVDGITCTAVDANKETLNRT